MEETITYKIIRLETVIRKSDGKEVVRVRAENSETNQVVEFLYMELSSMRLGDELEVTITNNE